MSHRGVCKRYPGPLFWRKEEALCFPRWPVTVQLCWLPPHPQKDLPLQGLYQGAGCALQGLPIAAAGLLPAGDTMSSLEKSNLVLPALWSRFSAAGRAIIAGQNYLLREEGFIINSYNWSFLPVRTFAVLLFRFLQLFAKRNESHVRQWFEDDCTE